MSPLDNDGAGGAGETGGLILPRSARRRGGASVTLREGAGPTDSLTSMMDPATKSLGDALKVTYRLLQAAMVVLLALFVFSGFSTVGANERAIRVRLGRAEPSELAPGPHFSWPAPLGELIRVPMGAESASISKQFYPNLTDGEEKMLAKDGKQSLANTGGDKIDPKVDGILLTADGNIAHARWDLTYRRDKPAQWAMNVDKDDEERIVLGAVRRGIVQAAASVTVDEFIKNQLDTQDRLGRLVSVEAMALKKAQQSLDQMGTGIVIQQLTMKQTIPPRRVMNEFYRVLSAESEAKTARQNAETEANGLLSAVAGDASPILLSQIDRYEKALASGDDANAEKVLDTIDNILSRKRVEIDGSPMTAAVFGDVTRLIDDANEYCTTLVNRTQADVGLFEAKREAFHNNPLVMVNGDWSSAYKAFLTRSNVQTMFLPFGTDRFILMINRDPSITAEQDSVTKQKEFDDAQRERNRKLERKRFEERVDPATKTQLDS